MNRELERVLGKSFLPAVVYCDNRAAGICAVCVGQKKLRHVVDIRAHYVRECVQHKLIDIYWVPTKDQEVDLMTKPLAQANHTRLTDCLLQILDSRKNENLKLKDRRVIDE